MNVSFTGINNIKSFKYTPNLYIHEHLYSLDGNVTGEDWKKFKRALKLAKTIDYADIDNPKHVNLTVYYNEDEPATFILNKKPLEPKHETIPLFDFIGHITRNIVSKRLQDLTPEKDYLLSKEFEKYFLDTFGENQMYENVATIMDIIFNKNNIKRNAKEINKLFDDKMREHFNI